jgi:hypothetical protein
VVGIAAILVTVIFWSVLPNHWALPESTDYFTFYEPVARNIVAGRGLVDVSGRPAMTYPPGYPLVLAGVFALSQAFHMPEAILLAALTLGSVTLTSLLLFWIARDVWGMPGALVSAALWFTYPFGLWLTKQPNSETPFMVLFVGGMCVFIRGLLRGRQLALHCGLAGVIVGLAMLIRPIAIGTGLVLALALWLVGTELTKRFRVLLIALLLGGILVPVGPWEAWMYATTGQAPLLCTNGTASVLDGLTFSVRNPSYRQGIQPDGNVKALEQEILRRTWELTTLPKIGAALAEQAREQPMAVLKLIALKAARSWYGTDSQRLETVNLLVQIPYLLVSLGAVAMAWRCGSRARKLMITSSLMVLYFWAMTIQALSILRYMVPAMGMLFLLVPALVYERFTLDPLAVRR